MALLFHSPDEDAQAWRQALLRRMPELDVRVWPDAGNLAEIDTALVWRAPPGLLASLPNLRLILSLGAGVDAMLADPTLPDLPLCRLVDPSLTRMMGEFVLTLVLKYHRQLDVFAREQRRARWSFALPPQPEATVVGILGLGELGAHAARRPGQPRLHGPRLESDPARARRRRHVRRPRGTGRVPGRHRHPGLSAAADRPDARHPRRRAAGRAAPRCPADQSRPRRAPGRAGPDRRPGSRSPGPCQPRLLRGRALAARAPVLAPPADRRHPACRELRPAGECGRRRGGQSAPAARRPAFAQPGRPGARLLTTRMETAWHAW